MSKYELTLVLPGKVTPAKRKSVVEKIKKLIITSKGKVAQVEDWGKRDLAFQIAGNSAGNFLFFELELKPGTAKDLDSKLNLEEDLIRYLLVRKEQK